MSSVTIENTNTESKKPKVSKKKKTEKVSENEDSSIKEELTKKETLPETTPNVEVKLEEIQVENDDQEAVVESEKTFSMETLLENYGNLVNTLEVISKENLKNYDVSKDSINQITKLMNKSIKLFGSIQISNNDFTTKETADSLKTKDAKSKKPKKNVAKENYAINKECETYKEVITFMNLDDNAKVSKAQLIKAINSFVKLEKEKKNPDIFFEENNKYFKLIGNLKILFEFIKKQMIVRGDLKNPEEFPKGIAYTQIMKYLKYCFPETEKDKK